MSKKNAFLSLVIVAFVGVAFGLRPTQPQATAWEYGTLVLGYYRTGDENLKIEDRASIQWQYGTDYWEFADEKATSSGSFNPKHASYSQESVVKCLQCKELGRPYNENTILSLLGDKGWELVHRERDKETLAWRTIMIFKRPR